MERAGIMEDSVLEAGSIDRILVKIMKILSEMVAKYSGIMVRLF